jgi:DivIVA domain-containing protein
VDRKSADRIRNASFSHAVRGYDRHEVDQFLAELADWLEASGGDAASERVRDELERIGEQTSNILTEAHDAGQTIRSEAEREVRQTLVDANLKSEALRAEADEYAEQAREEADTYARKARADADGYAHKTRADADGYAAAAHQEADGARKEARGAAQREAQQVVEGATQRRRQIEKVISDLEERRDVVLGELERLASGLAGTATQHRDTARGDGDGDEPAGDGEAPAGQRQTAQKSN